MSASRGVDPRILGVPKEVVDEAARTLRNARASLDSFTENLAGLAASGGVAETDETWVRASHHRTRAARRQLFRWAAWNTSLALGNIQDHVTSMERTLVGEPVAVWPLVSLSRVVQEGAVRTCHLFDAASSSEQRLARIAAAWLGSAQQHLTAAREFDPQVVPAAERDWARAERTATAAGLTIGTDKKDHPRKVTMGSASAPFALNLTEATRARPQHLRSWYRISSAASHSSSWLVQQASALDEKGQLVMYADADTICAATLSVLAAFEDLTHTLGTYHGRDPRRAVATVQSRAKAVLLRQTRWRDQMRRDIRELYG
ncbi:hypothetical protein [Streptomyces melanogenes]|uniref:hypothetical protein n=1 Tax=Streptomyces melanogenes TaxID=67326 RepID=UPI00378E7ACE